MDINRYIHPRNKYKKSPDYKKLAIMYPDFREIAITDLAGKVRINFQNKQSLRVLTETLLKHDFDLHVKIPLDNLVPVITLRMNYILWIEDLIKHSKLQMDTVRGIDIGTGAICIYALLLAKIYGCRMIGTEIDRKSMEYAEKCVKRNNLQDLIKVITVNPDKIFKDVIEKDEVYDFSMCNPPFFENEEGDVKIAKALPPRNAPTGSNNELKIEGGEITFVTRMIDESIELREHVKIYTTMIGKKSDFLYLKKLIKSKNINNVTWTEFCQGHTTRWGLAWSFLPKNTVDMSTAPVIRKNGRSIVPILKKDPKSLIMFPVKDKFSCMDDVINFLKAMAKELNIKLQEVPISENDFNSWVCRIIATELSWEHTRRKRRLAQRQIAIKKMKSENSGDTEMDINASEVLNTMPTAKEIKQFTEDLSNERLSAKKEKNENSDERIRIPILTCKLCVEIENSKIEVTQNVFKIWMIFENGSGGMMALHSLRQYLINKLGVKEKIFRDSKPAKKKKKRTKRKSCGIDTNISAERFLSNDNKEEKNF